MPDTRWNLAVWDRDYKWSADGDEWSQFAEACGVPYASWKDSLARAFLIPYLKEMSVVAEIGPGHGRWTVMIGPRIKKGTLHLVELSPACIEFLKKRLRQAHDSAFHEGHDHTKPGGCGPTGVSGMCGVSIKPYYCEDIQYHVNDGKSLPMLQKASVDFVFSFDSFVHIEEPEIRSYAKEFFRVLKPQGMGVIHHVGNPTPEQRQSGARSKVGGRQFMDILREAGFFVIRQTDEWSGGNIKLTGDTISVFVKP